MPNKNLKGITIEIGGDTTNLYKELSKVDAKSRSLQSELREVDRLLKLDPKNTDLLAQKQKLLAESVGETKKRLDTLKEAQQKAAAALASGEMGEDQYRILQREIVSTEQKLKSLEDQSKKTEKQFSLSKETLKKMDKAATVGGVAILGVGTASYAAANELEATEAKYSTVFGEFRAQSDQFIQEFQKLTPATKAEARSMASGLQDLLVPMGFARDQATNMTGDTMHLIGALTNFNSATETSESVTTKFAAALTGEYSSLKSLGIQVNDQIVKEKAVAMGLASNTNEVNAQAKAQALLQLATEQSSDALSAYNEESLDSKTKNDLMKKSLVDTGAEIGQIFKPAIDGVLAIVRNLVKNKGLVLGLLGAVTALVLAVKGFMFITALMESFKKFQSMMATQKAVTAGVTAAQNGLNLSFLASPITWIVLGIVALVAAFVILWNKSEAFRQFWTNLWDGIVAGFNATVDWFKNLFTVVIPSFFSGLVEFIANIFSTDWTAQFGIFGNVINAFFANIQNVFGSIKQIFTGIIDFVKGVFTGDWQLVWDGVKSIFSGIFGGLMDIAKVPINGIIGMLNGMVDAVNWAIKQINKLSFDVPDWVPFIGGQKWGFNLPKLGKIPYLAKGGVLTSGQAIVAEAGPELITMVNGKTIVKPLTNSAKNTPLDGASAVGGKQISQVNNFYSPKALSPAETARQNRKMLHSLLGV